MPKPAVVAAEHPEPECLPDIVADKPHAAVAEAGLNAADMLAAGLALTVVIAVFVTSHSMLGT